MLQREYRFEREIERDARDGAKVLAQRCQCQCGGLVLKTNAIPGTLAAVTDLVVSRKKTTVG